MVTSSFQPKMTAVTPVSQLDNADEKELKKLEDETGTPTRRK
jgi:hypothetical protein